LNVWQSLTEHYYAGGICSSTMALDFNYPPLSCPSAVPVAGWSGRLMNDRKYEDRLTEDDSALEGLSGG